MISEFHFMRPWYLVLLLLPIIFGWSFFKNTDNKSSWEGVIDKHLLEFLLIKGSSSLRKFVATSVWVGIVSAIIAVAGPAWKKRDVPTLSPDNPVMILLSLSSDMVESDITPDRLTRAKFKIQDLLKLIKGSQAGLIVYTNEPFLITPITADLGLVNNLLEQIDFDIMPMDGDRLDRAIDLAASRLKDAGYRNANIVIMAADGGQHFDLSLKAAEASGFKVSAINISKQNMDKLRVLTDKSGGVMANVAAGDEDVKKIATLINSSISEELKLTENLRSSFEDFGYYLLITPMLCCLYLFRKGILVVALMLCAWPAQAAFFLNSNQMGLKDFNEGNFAKAAGEFEDAKWKASALYKAGDYEAALTGFSGEDVSAKYNQGNALAKSGKIEEAIKKYEEVLEVEPEHEDAKFNLEYLKKQKDNQQQQNQSQSGGGESEKSKDGSDNESSQDKGGDSSADGESQKPEQGSEGQQNQTQGSNGNEEKNKDNSNTAPSQPSLERGGEDSANSELQDAEQGGKEEKNNMDERLHPQPNSPPSRERESSVGAGEPLDEESDGYGEERQAREQQYREIPDDTGGLLRAFIAKEYRKNRYEE